MLRTAVASALPPAPAPVVIACSGGPDSAGLLRLAAEAMPSDRLVAVHVRHGLRDDAADRDCARGQAVAVGAAFVEVAVTVTGSGAGVAAAARQARLDALAEAAVAHGAGDVLLAHTADDRAETIALNVARGSGLAGLAAMAPRRAHCGVWLHHPLRSVRRADVRVVAAEGPATARDPSNADPRRRRTRARHDVLPALASLSGGDGDPVAALTRLGDLAADDATVLDELAAGHARRLQRVWGPAVAVDAAGLDALPVALARRVVRDTLYRVAGAVPSADAVETARALAGGKRRTVDGAVAVARQGGWLVARPEAAHPVAAQAVPAPGDVVVAPLAVRLRVDRRERAPAAGSPGLVPATAIAPRSTRAAAPALMHLRGPVTLRARVAGDRLWLHGVERPVADVLRRAAVPGLLRDLVAVVVEDDGRLAGLVGVAAADAPPAAPWRAWAEAAASPRTALP